MLLKGKRPSQQTAKKQPSKPQLSAKGTKRAENRQEPEKQPNIDSEELNDVVHDIEYSRHLMERADEFLNDGVTSVSGESKTSRASFISQNKEKALKRQSKLNRNKDRLDEKGQRRYEELNAAIESNLDAIIADKKESLLGDDQSISRYSVGSNVYSMQGESRSLMEDIDRKLRLCNPDAVILPLPAADSTLKQGFEQSLKGI